MSTGTGESRSVQGVWDRLINMPRYQKRVALISLDFLLLCLALWIPITLRLGEPFFPGSTQQAALLLLGPVISLVTLWRVGVYRLVTRFIGTIGASRIFLSIGFSMLVWSLVVFMSGQIGVPRTVVLAYGVLGGLLLSIVRYVIGVILDSAGVPYPPRPKKASRKRLLIYGTGRTVIALQQAIKRAGDRRAVALVDPSSTMWGQYVGGLKVYGPDKLERLIEREQIEEVVVALPGPLHRERRRVLQDLGRLGMDVKILPAFEDIASGRVALTDLRPVEITDLLGREPVQPSAELLKRNIQGKALLMTGAGGSIGSELVRQALQQGPRLMVLLEISEIALYEIENEVRAQIDAMPETVARPEIKGVLGSVTDDAFVSEVITQNKIETIYHAAAYKHVPIVESNPVAGLENNVFGTQVVARCARRHGVERVVFISTDKAVRPTNIMGASKRLAELVLQSEAQQSTSTVFTMVRFGNVLNSSGSVVRRFRQQIEAGGPVTVTHPDIVRYFMSIPEAAELVIQAGAMAKGGEVFVLHMGDPVRIDDLARDMVRLSGLEVRDASNPEGDIEIVYTGLRPGEKLYEELLIGHNTSTTEHQRIFKSAEPFMPADLLALELDELKAAMRLRNVDAIQKVLLRTVEGYRRDGDRVAISDTQAVPEGARVRALALGSSSGGKVVPFRTKS